MQNKLVLFFITGFLLAECSVFETSEATNILKNKVYTPTKPDEIEIYLDKPGREYILIGLVESRGMGLSTEKRDLELSMKALKDEAANIGANAVIITSSEQKIAEVTSNGTSTERRIKGAAIRFK